MGVSAEELYWCRGFDLPDRRINGAKSRCAGIRTNWVVTCNYEHVDWLRVVYCVQEPLLSHHSRCRCHLGHVAVAGKVEENAKRHDSKALLSGKVPVWNTDILELSSISIQNLDVGSDISITINFRELAEGLICYLGDV